MAAALRTAAAWRMETLATSHDRLVFSCGSEPLDRYFKTQVTQDIRRRVAKCVVAVDIATDAVAGYYTLSATSLALADLPESSVKALPRYPAVPAVLLGRLAVATVAQGRQLGSAMLAHAIEYVAMSQIGAYAIVVDAKDDAAQRFYERHGFETIIGHQHRLILPVATAMKLIGPSA